MRKAEFNELVDFELAKLKKFKTGITEGHFHTYRKDDVKTSIDDGHNHLINKDGSILSENGHTHTKGT